MESKRQQKVGRQIQKDLGDIFQKEASHLLDGSLITVTGVKISPDLSIARAYVSILPDQKKNSVLEALKDNAKFLRQKLGNRVRHQLRIVPDLYLYLDDTLEYVEKMDKLFSGIVIPPPGEDGTEGDYKL
jgi:ribosome-binding factor A